VIASCLHCRGNVVERSDLGLWCLQCARSISGPAPKPPAPKPHSSGVRLAVPPEHQPARNSRGKLSKFQLDVIRHLKGCIPQGDVAFVFDISQVAVSQIQRGLRRSDLGQRFDRAVTAGGGK
jgi:hypothetical protein